MSKIARNIYIDDVDWRKLKILAAEKSDTATGLIRKLVDNLLIEEGKKEKQEDLL